MRLLQYGAGSIGRGFIAPLFAQNGWETVFVDIDRTLVNHLNMHGSYTLCYAGQEQQTEQIQNIRAVDGRDEAAVLREICNCDFLSVSLGAAVLERVAPLLAQGIARRMELRRMPLDILICENLKDAAQHLESWIAAAIPQKQQASWRASCGLVECAIGRMVPAVQDGNKQTLCVESYDFLPVDKTAFRGEIPAIAQLVPHAPFSFYEERKLYLHNMAHALCAYCGSFAHFEGIAQAISNPYILLITQAAMTEASAMLAKKYGKEFMEIFAHAEDLLRRFANIALGDSCARVGRDPLRKLAKDDRLAGAMHACRGQEITPAAIALGYAAGLFAAEKNKQQAKELALTHGGLALRDCVLVMEFYTQFQNNIPLPQLFHFLQMKKNALRGDIV